MRKTARNYLCSAVTACERERTITAAPGIRSKRARCWCASTAPSPTPDSHPTIDQDEEGGGDLLLRLTLLTQGEEGADLIERVQWRPLHVLGEAVLHRIANRADHARDGRSAGQPLLHEQLEGAIAPAA